MRKVIVNSTPLIALHRIGMLSLLREMYGEITVPEAVFHEVTVKQDALRCFLLQNSDWIHVRAVANPDDRRMFRTRLHSGEVEVIILAQELHAELVIIDDLAARRTAEYLGLPLTGTIGVLLKAKENGQITHVLPLIDLMRSQGIHISPELRNTIKKLAKE